MPCLGAARAWRMRKPAVLNSFHRSLRLYRKRFDEYLAGYSRKSLWLIAKAKELIAYGI
jgi:hypothetical protein